MARVIAIIQARLGSTRLPGKVLMKLEGKTVLERVVERVVRSRFVDEVVVATTMAREDLKIVGLCAARGIRVYCGSDSDVLDRYYQAARLVNADHIVRVTSDCPVIDSVIIDQVVSLHLKKRADLTANVLTETFPDGQDVEVFTFGALAKAWIYARLASEREHVTPYIKKRIRQFKLVNLECPENHHGKRWTLDNPEDYEFIKAVYRELRRDRCFGMDAVLGLLKRRPELERINGHIARNAGYGKSLREDRVLK